MGIQGCILYTVIIHGLELFRFERILARLTGLSLLFRPDYSLRLRVRGASAYAFAVMPQVLLRFLKLGEVRKFRI